MASHRVSGSLNTERRGLKSSPSKTGGNASTFAIGICTANAGTPLWRQSLSQHMLQVGALQFVNPYEQVVSNRQCHPGSLTSQPESQNPSQDMCWQFSSLPVSVLIYSTLQSPQQSCPQKKEMGEIRLDQPDGDKTLCESYRNGFGNWRNQGEEVSVELLEFIVVLLCLQIFKKHPRAVLQTTIVQLGLKNSNSFIQRVFDQNCFDTISLHWLWTPMS